MKPTLAVLILLLHGPSSLARQAGESTPLISSSSRRLSSAIERALPLWVESWRGKDPSFTVSTFTLVREGAYTPEYTVAFSPSDDEDIRERLYACSSGRSRCVDPYVLTSFERSDDGIEVMSDVDQGVALIDMKKKTWTRLLFCGPSCGFQDAVWLDTETIAVVGSETHEPGKRDEPCTGGRPCVAAATATIIDLKHGRMLALQGPETKEPVDTDEYVARRLSALALLVTRP